MNANTNKSFWQRTAGLYEKAMKPQEGMYKAVRKGIAPVLNEKQNVLELACGTGQLSFELSKYVHFWEATDFSEKMIAKAKEKPHISRLHFSVQDATNLPYADKTFDVVVISNALHIMPEPEKAMAEIRRVLKPGGLLFAPNFVQGGTKTARFKQFLLGLAGFRIYHKWTAKGYIAFIKKTGFNIVEAHKITSKKFMPICFVTAQ